MPELPEVETVKNVLLPIVKNRSIVKIDILRQSIVHDDPEHFKSILERQTFLNITRIGKFLIFHLTNDIVLISHLRMEGKYYEIKEDEPNSKYARVVFHLDNNMKLCYDDSRTFGMMLLSTEKEYKNEKEIAKLGQEPFVIKDVSYLLKACKRKNLPIKTTLLSQELITGLGNIYVDEVLYASNIHPLTPASKISKKEWELIVKNSVIILNEAIEMGGSTIKSYHPGKDIDGNFQTRIKIYGKSGETCPHCQSTFRFIKVGGRGTTFCPKCQMKKGAPLTIALTGKIASGKSTVLDVFKKRGYPTISSDQIVDEIYKDSSVTKLIEKGLGISFGGTVVDKNILRNHLVNNDKDKKKLEKIVHPIVKQRIQKFLANNKDFLKIVEIPLLFESKMDNMFDVIVITTINQEKQKELLVSRDKEKATILADINKNNIIDKNLGKASFVLNNNGTKKGLEDQTNILINKLQELA